MLVATLATDLIRIEMQRLDTGVAGAVDIEPDAVTNVNRVTWLDADSGKSHPEDSGIRLLHSDDTGDDDGVHLGARAWPDLADPELPKLLLQGRGGVGHDGDLSRSARKPTQSLEGIPDGAAPRSAPRNEHPS